jgi:8-oxo-dGTP diphosphatase
MKRAPEQLRFAAMAVDAVVFAFFEGKPHVLIAEVSSESAYQGMMAFPGGLIQESENADEALVRVLKEKVNITPAHSEQLYTFSEVDRDKRNRVVSVAYLCFVRPDTAARFAVEGARFVPVNKLPALAYDHADICQVARKRLRGKLTYTTIAQFLLPRHFTLTELQEVYESIIGTELDKRNFRKKILALDIVKDTGKMQEGVKNRPAALYEFTSQKLKELPLMV